MARLLFHYLPIYNNEDLRKYVFFCQKLNTLKITNYFSLFAKVVKILQI